VKGADLKRLRERNGWSQSDLANALNVALERSYGTGSISPWENDRRNIPADVARFCEQLMLETALPDAGSSPTPPDGEPVAADEAPGPGAAPAGVAQPVLVSGSGAYAKACEELWEMIGAAVGMAGGAVRSDVLIDDGAIIVRDKAALGSAWGKLAETNDTFRKMLVSMTEGGAWMQVALATGTTFAKVSANHAEHARAARERATLNGNGYVEPAPV
jgi:hypothetical protein